MSQRRPGASRKAATASGALRSSTGSAVGCGRLEGPSVATAATNEKYSVIPVPTIVLFVNDKRLMAHSYEAYLTNRMREAHPARSARGLRADNRLVLSGTPLENRLLDLWSLMTLDRKSVV